MTVGLWLSKRRHWPVDAAGVAVVVLVAVTTIEKISFRSGAPLWMDEVWTGMIASQTSFGEVVRQCYLDVNAPLGYLIAWLWAIPSGLSNVALRFPSVLFASLTPIVILASTRTIDRTVRLIWCCLTACWLPGLLLASEARCYPLVLFLATANAIAFVRLFRSPSLGTALVWTSLSSLLILTHYVAGVMVACQGLAYLAIHRAKAVRTWPAALAFVPAAASIAAHAALLVGFSNPGVAYVAPSRRLTNVWGIAGFFGGDEAGCTLILAWASVAVLIGVLRRRFTPAPTASSEDEFEDHALLTVSALSAAAVVLCLAISLWRPILVTRYLTPMVPGVLLGLALAARRLARSWRLAPAALIAIEFGLGLGLLLGPGSRIKPLNFQEASEYLMQRGARRLVFLWDDPSVRGADPVALSELGGFFFRRASRPVPVDPVSLVPGEDPNRALLDRASAPGTAILWLYDEAVVGTAALRTPPALGRTDARWRCRDFGDGLQHALACSRDGG
jgi:hypothetical protein